MKKYKIKASEILIHHLMKYFDNDLKKIDLWIFLANPEFGGVSPNYMIKNGKEYKVISHIENLINGCSA